MCTDGHRKRSGREAAVRSRECPFGTSAKVAWGNPYPFLEPRLWRATLRLPDSSGGSKFFDETKTPRGCSTIHIHLRRARAAGGLHPYHPKTDSCRRARGSDRGVSVSDRSRLGGGGLLNELPFSVKRCAAIRNSGSRGLAHG